MVAKQKRTIGIAGKHKGEERCAHLLLWSPTGVQSLVVRDVWVNNEGRVAALAVSQIKGAACKSDMEPETPPSPHGNRAGSREGALEPCSSSAGWTFAILAHSHYYDYKVGQYWRFHKMCGTKLQE
jgi:hypothetical protein